MSTRRQSGRIPGSVALLVFAILCLSACGGRTESKKPSDLAEFGTRYAAAWSGQDPDALASFYEEGGSLRVNAGEPAVGRAAIAAKARAFMEAFPDMVVTMDSVEREGDGAVFRWTWTGTNTGPGGTGNAVAIQGYEEWTFGAEGLILESKGHYDEAEYERQVNGENRQEDRKSD